MYDTTYALSAQFTLNDAFARIKNYLGQDVRFDMKDGQIMNALKHRMMRMYSVAYDKMREIYHTIKVDMTVVTGTVTDRMIDSSTIPLVTDITGVTGTSGVSYEPAQNIKDLMSALDGGNGSEMAGGRLFLFLRESRKIHLSHGPNVTAPSTLNVWYVRMPMVNFDLAEVRNTANYIDVPDEWLNYVIVGTAFDMTESEGVKRSATLNNDYIAFVKSVEDSMLTRDQQRKAMNKD